MNATGRHSLLFIYLFMLQSCHGVYIFRAAANSFTALFLFLAAVLLRNICSRVLMV